MQDGLGKHGFAAAAVTQQYNIADVIDICHFFESPKK
jgi:hypothetical protein